MKRSLRDLLLFCCPIALVLGVPMLILARMGELDAVDVSEVFRRQSEDGAETYFGPAYTNCAFA